VSRQIGQLILLEVLVCAIAIGYMTSAAGAQSRDHDAIGLGEYGHVGTIVREQLPDGLQGLVSDAALATANDPVFAATRASWDVEADFVGQVDYQLSFRSKVDFMSRDYKHIAGLLLDRPSNMGSETMGLFISAAEVAEMSRRDALGDRMNLLVESVTGTSLDQVPEGILPEYGPNFGGIWQDQLDGGRIVLSVLDASTVDLDALARIVGGQQHLRVIEQHFTYNQIETYRRQLHAELDTIGMDRDIEAVRSDRGRLLEVRVTDPEKLPESFGQGVPDTAFWVVEGEPLVELGAPASTHSLTDQQPGLRVSVLETGQGASWCTWGFNGHTSSLHYLILAGHCMPESYENHGGNWIGSDIEINQNGDAARNLTPGDSYLYSHDTDTYDAARISSLYANDNCYHGNNAVSAPSPHCRWPMATRAWHNSWDIGSDLTCASLGNSNAYRCGYIEEINSGNGNRTRVSMAVNSGDSGSGMKFGYRIDGILTDKSTTDAFFQTAYHVQVALGNGYFYFNCHSSSIITYTDPADWGACPAVDA